MRTKNNLVYHTFIGLPVQVIRSSLRNLQGLKGKIIDETKNLLIIETSNGEKKLPKISCTFRFFLDGCWLDIDGKTIAFRPEERAKKLL